MAGRTALILGDQRLAGNRRMNMPLRNLTRIEATELEQIRSRGRELREHFDA